MPSSELRSSAPHEAGGGRRGRRQASKDQYGGPGGGSFPDINIVSAASAAASLSLSLSSPPRCDALHQRRWSDWLALLGSMALRTGSVPQFSQFLVSGILVDGLEIDQIVFSPLWFSMCGSVKGLTNNICYQLDHPSTLPRMAWSARLVGLLY